MAVGPKHRQRYEALLKAMLDLRSTSWGEPMSFWVLRTDKGLDETCLTLAKSLDAKTDLVVVGELHAHDVTYYGTLQHPDVFTEVFPRARKLGDV